MKIVLTIEFKDEYNMNTPRKYSDFGGEFLMAARDILNRHQIGDLVMTLDFVDMKYVEVKE
jgi:hypothetical protein